MKSCPVKESNFIIDFVFTSNNTATLEDTNILRNVSSMSAWAKVKYRFHPKNIEKFDGKRFKMKLTNCYELLIPLKGTAKKIHTYST